MKIGSTILWLSEKDVASLLTMEDALQAVEEAFLLYGQKKVVMPAKVYLQFPPHQGDLRAMPSYLRDPVNAAGVKIVNSNPANPARGLPAVAGIMVYVDPPTGLPLGVFGAGTLTALRTGAAGGVAAKFLARKNSRTVGLVGCGRQARTQLEALIRLFSIEKVLVWGKLKNEAAEFCQKNRSLYSALTPSDSLPQVCDSDIVVTTTPSSSPVVKAEWIRPGTHINAIGADAPGKQELEISLLKKSQVVVDEWQQASHGGEINVACQEGKITRQDILGELGEIVAGSKPGRLHDTDITIFDSTGLAIQDAAVSRILFEKAQTQKKGQVLELYG